MVWARAQYLAEGDPHRIIILSPTEVLVLNTPAPYHPAHPYFYHAQA